MDRKPSIFKINLLSHLPEMSITFLSLLAFIFLISLLFFGHITGATQNHELIRNLGFVIAALFGFPMIIWRTHIASRQAATAEDSHVAETYTKAIEQLGAANDAGIPKLELRLGALYALEKIAKNNHSYHSQIMEVLCAYVRLHARVEGENKSDTSVPNTAHFSPREDIQTAVTILCRRNLEFDQDNFRPDLSAVDLQGIDLSNQRLENYNFARSNLRKAWIKGASLISCNFDLSTLDNANLSKCDISKCSFNGTFLRDVFLEKSTFLDCELKHATLTGAILSSGAIQNVDANGANLHGAFLDSVQITDSYFTLCHFESANLSGSKLTNTDVNRSHFQESILTNTSFKSVTVNKASFAEAEIYQTTFEDMELYSCDLSAEMLFHSRLVNIAPTSLSEEVTELRQSANKKQTDTAAPL
ncbi:pentapeptide repeat-containing protein [Pontibacterium sp.]|uniref:pentapeptide repeat-containing protein n=1 Tax=Pontibacterium sp. TaxID=2036026 RepID=UPI0035144D70